MEARSTPGTNLREGEVPVSRLGPSWTLGVERRQHQDRHQVLSEETPVNEATWLALETELEDGLTARRRLREKTHPMVRKAKRKKFAEDAKK